MCDDDRGLVVEAEPQPSYTIDKLLASSDYSEPPSAEERAWIDAPLIGKEIW